MQQESMFDDEFTPNEPEPHAGRKAYVVPPNATPRTCRGCGATFYWAPTGTGATMPISEATMFVRQDERLGYPHWYDCPARERFRKSPQKS